MAHIIAVVNMLVTDVQLVSIQIAPLVMIIILNCSAHYASLRSLRRAGLSSVTQYVHGEQKRAKRAAWTVVKLTPYGGVAKRSQ